MHLLIFKEGKLFREILMQTQISSTLVTAGIKGVKEGISTSSTR